MGIQKHLVVAACIALSVVACSKKTASAQSTLDVVQSVVSSETLGDNVAYVERIIGVPARRTAVDPLGYARRIYELGRCVIEIGEMDGKVVSIKTNLIPGHCDVEVSLNVRSQKPMYASQTTYNDWSRRGGYYHFVSSVFALCNACGDPSFPHMYTIGNGPAGYFDIAIGGSGETGVRGQYADEYPWFSEIDRLGLNTQNLPNQAYECPLSRFSQVGLNAMGEARVQWIEFGEAGAVQPACNPLTALKNIRGSYVGLNH